MAGSVLKQRFFKITRSGRTKAKRFKKPRFCPTVQVLFVK